MPIEAVPIEAVPIEAVPIEAVPIEAVPISIDDILTAHRDYEQKAFVESLLQKSRICRRYSGSEASSADLWV
ncbi:MAG: hypothetical protein COB43_01125 [Oceanospirillales bacterium]|nr:MAG: hypothetical protein COB43_01125 [Oceanospirillales bacterium]